MGKWMAPLVLLLTIAWAGRAEASRVTGDPFVAPLPLAGSWRAVAADMTPAEADSVDISSWHPMDVPGKWQGTALEGHRGKAWYGLDIGLEATERPRDATLTLLLPPFLAAYEAYVNGELVGSSGVFDPAERGPNRHRSFELSPELSTQSTLRLRVRVNAVRHDGTFSASQPIGVALGRPAAIASLEQLVANRIASLPHLQAGHIYRPLFIGIGLLMLLIYLLDRRRHEYGWYALMLLSSVTMQYLAAGATRGATWHTTHWFGPQWVLHLVSTTAMYQTLVIMLDQKGKLVTAALWLPWIATPLVVVQSVAPAVALASQWFEPLSAVHIVACGLMGLVILLRGWRGRQPDARTLTIGFGLALLLQIAGYVVMQAGGNLEVGGWAGAFRVPLELAAATAYFGTTAVVLAQRYCRAFRDLERSYAASERFVPAAFLGLLGRDNVVAVRRGDSSARQMTVMFSDIRGFTRMSERRAPEGNFAFINRYLERMEPCITSNGGFINQYYGDGIMAMFTTADGALHAARAMQRTVDELSDELEQEGEDRLRVGIGVHTGPLMLGTIGGSTRLDTGVIGDAVNLTARVEGMTKHYGSRVLLTGATRQALDEAQRFALREIDTNRAVGRDESIDVVQLLDAEDDETREGIVGTLESFARGLEAYRQGAFEAAAACMDEVIATADDGAARWLREHSLALASTPPPDWDGVTVLKAK